jgi:outer membrane assembly lipoprotein YfgL
MNAVNAVMSGSRRLAGLCTALLAIAVIAGCAASKPKPQPLEPLTAKMAAPLAWSGSVPGVEFPLAISIVKGTFTVAGNDGTVLALDAATGRELWRANAGAKLSAGVGSDGRFAAVVTRDGDVVVFDQGQLKWKKPLITRVNTAPLVAGERVFVLGIDRSVTAFDAADGRKLWSVARPGDALTLAQSGVLAAFKNTLVVGQGPRMDGLDPMNGQVRWDVAIGSPRGANEIERLADLVGPSVRIGDVICARSFQAAVGCVDAEKGVTLWSKNIGGTDAVAADAQFVFAADATDRLSAWTIKGESTWTSDKLLYRELGSPVSVGNAVVFGDGDGMLHFMSRETGEALLRVTTDGSAVVAQPALAGDVMLVVTRKGGLFAYRPK